MRVYPINVTNETGVNEQRAAIDAEDLYEYMIEREINNFSVLENWYVLRLQVAEATAGNELLPPLPPAAAEAPAPGPAAAEAPQYLKK